MPVAPAKQKKYVVLGSTGQLGHDLCPRLPGQVVGLTRADIDLTRANLVRGILDGLRPAVVVGALVLAAGGVAALALPGRRAVAVRSGRSITVPAQAAAAVPAEV